MDLAVWTEEWVVLGVELQVGSDEWVGARGGLSSMDRGVGGARVELEVGSDEWVGARGGFRGVVRTSRLQLVLDYECSSTVIELSTFVHILVYKKNIVSITFSLSSLNDKC